MGDIRRINTRRQLQELAVELGVTRDWHEPDNQDVNVLGFGVHFDNAGFWGLQHLAERETRARTVLVKTEDGWAMEDAQSFVEMFVVLYKNGRAVAEVNLATLFAFACGTYSG